MSRPPASPHLQEVAGDLEDEVRCSSATGEPGDLPRGVDGDNEPVRDRLVGAPPVDRRCSGGGVPPGLNTMYPAATLLVIVTFTAIAVASTGPTSAAFALPASMLRRSATETSHSITGLLTGVVARVPSDVERCRESYGANATCHNDPLALDVGIHTRPASGTGVDTGECTPPARPKLGRPSSCAPRRGRPEMACVVAREAARHESTPRHCVILVLLAPAAGVGPG